MTENKLESRLRETRLPLPPEELRGRLLSRAQGRVRPRARQWQWALAVVAGLLVAINLGFDAHHARRMEALLGPAPPASAVAISPEAWRAQQQMLAELLGDPPQPERRPDHDCGPLSDLPACSARLA